jgi:hypothetical protein
MPHGEFIKLPGKTEQRINLRSVDDADIDLWLGGLSVPLPKILFRAFYGADFARVMARAFGRRKNTIYLIGTGSLGIPRFFLKRMIEAWENPKLRRQWEVQQRAKLEAELVRAAERRSAVVRWCKIILAEADK